MCFGGGSSRPEPVSPTVTQEQKEQKKEEFHKYSLKAYQLDPENPEALIVLSQSYFMLCRSS